MEDEEVKVVKPPPPYKPIKYFVGGLNTFFGKELVKQLRNDDIHPENPNRIVGTLSPSSKEPVPQGVRKVIDVRSKLAQTTKITFLQDIVLDSDVIILDLNTCDLKEAEFAISTLKVTKSPEPKTLICVSTIMCWALTPAKEKKEEEGEEVDDGAGEQPDTEQEGKDDGGQPKKTYVRFTEKDYTLRRPSPKYEQIKSLQTLCLAAGKARESLKSYILCAGVLYGNGEVVFRDYFEQARLQKPTELSYYGEGKNRIPMVHVKDLVTYVKKVVERPPATQYLLAIDHNPKPTLKKIVEAISTGVGTGKVKKAAPDPNNPHIEVLSINLRMRPSLCFQKLEEEQAAIEVEEGSGKVWCKVDVKKFKFDWECKEGLQKNIKKLCDQFKEAENYKQVKIFITGPPACGKTHYAKILSEEYYLPHLTIKDVIQQVMALQNNPLAEEVTAFMTSEKQRLVEEGKTAFEQRKQKWKKIPKDQREPLEPFAEDKVQPILNDELLYKCFEWRLSQNDCVNRGYVLDGFPRTYDNAKNIFMALPPAVGDQQENTVKEINPIALPTKVFILQASDDQILHNLKQLPEEKLTGHLNEADTLRRLKIYRKLNKANTGVETLEDFFLENNVQVHHLKIGPELQKSLESFVQPVSPNEEQQTVKLAEQVKKHRQQARLMRQKQDHKEKINRDIQLEDYKIKKENEQNEEKQILEKKSLALRKYLDVNVVPFLMEGIQEILKDLPSNPVDHLAEFLFKMSLKVPNPDPATFEL